MPILWVLVRYPDAKREPEAFLCTDTEASPREVLNLFSRRWSMETTYEEARAHLGVETQRQWSDPAIFRTTPLLLGLYSLVALYVHQACRAPRTLAASGGMVSQAGRDLRRRAGAIAAPSVVRACRRISRQGRHDGTYPARAAPPHRDSLLRALRWRPAIAPAQLKCAKSRLTFVS